METGRAWPVPPKRAVFGGPPKPSASPPPLRPAPDPAWGSRIAHRAGARLLTVCLSRSGLARQCLTCWRVKFRRVAASIARGEVAAEAAIEISQSLGLVQGAGTRMMRAISKRGTNARLARAVAGWSAAAWFWRHRHSELVASAGSELNHAVAQSEARADSLSEYAVGLERYLQQRAAAQLLNLEARRLVWAAARLVRDWWASSWSWRERRAMGCRGLACAAAGVATRAAESLVAGLVRGWSRQAVRARTRQAAGGMLFTLWHWGLDTRCARSLQQWSRRMRAAQVRDLQGQLLSERLEALQGSTREMDRHCASEEELHGALEQLRGQLLWLGVMTLQWVLTRAGAAARRQGVMIWRANIQAERAGRQMALRRVRRVWVDEWHRASEQQLRELLRGWADGLSATTAMRATNLQAMHGLDGQVHRWQQEATRWLLTAWRQNMKRAYEQRHQSEMASTISVLWRSEVCNGLSRLKGMVWLWDRASLVAVLRSWKCLHVAGSLTTEMQDAEHEMIQQQLQDQQQLDIFMKEAAARSITWFVMARSRAAAQNALWHWHHNWYCRLLLAQSDAEHNQMIGRFVAGQQQQRLGSLGRILTDSAVPLASVLLRDWRQQTLQHRADLALAREQQESMHQHSMAQSQLDSFASEAGARTLRGWLALHQSLLLARIVHDWQSEMLMAGYGGQLVLLAAKGRIATRQSLMRSVVRRWRTNAQQVFSAHGVAMERIRRALWHLTLHAARAAVLTWLGSKSRDNLYRARASAVLAGLHRSSDHAKCRRVCFTALVGLYSEQRVSRRMQLALQGWAAAASHSKATMVAVRLVLEWKTRERRCRRLRHAVSGWHAGTHASQLSHLLNEHALAQQVDAAHHTATRVQAEKHIEQVGLSRAAPVLLRAAIKLRVSAAQRAVRQILRGTIRSKGMIQLTGVASMYRASVLKAAAKQEGIMCWVKNLLRDSSQLLAVRKVVDAMWDAQLRDARAFARAWRSNSAMHHTRTTRMQGLQAGGRVAQHVLSRWHQQAVHRAVHRWIRRMLYLTREHLQKDLEIKASRLALLPRPNSKCYTAIKQWNSNAARAMVLAQLHAALASQPGDVTTAISRAIALHSSLDGQSGLTNLRDVLRYREAPLQEEVTSAPATAQTPSVLPGSPPAEDEGSGQSGVGTNYSTLRAWAAGVDSLPVPPGVAGRVLDGKKPAPPQPGNGPLSTPSRLNFEQLVEWANKNTDEPLR